MIEGSVTIGNIVLEEHTLGILTSALERRSDLLKEMWIVMFMKR